MQDSANGVPRTPQAVKKSLSAVRWSKTESKHLEIKAKTLQMRGFESFSGTQKGHGAVFQHAGVFYELRV